MPRGLGGYKSQAELLFQQMWPQALYEATPIEICVPKTHRVDFTLWLEDGSFLLMEVKGYNRRDPGLYDYARTVLAIMKKYPHFRDRYLIIGLSTRCKKTHKWIPARGTYGKSVGKGRHRTTIVEWAREHGIAACYMHECHTYIPYHVKTRLKTSIPSDYKSLDFVGRKMSERFTKE